MSRLIVCAGVVFLASGLAETSGAEGKDKEPWSKAVAKPFQGRWTTSRDFKGDDGKVRRRRLDLEFAGGTLTFTTFDGDDKAGQSYELDVTGVEHGEGASRFVLALRGKGRGSVVYYAFQGGKLVLVGNGPPSRPIESFPLSGEFKRLEAAK
jgi:hypothetical protein